MLTLVHAVVAQVSGGAGFPWGDVLKIGVTPVIVVVLLGLRIFRIGADVDNQVAKLEALWSERSKLESDRADRAERRAEASEERERRLRDVAEEKFLPVLNQASNTMERVLDYILGQLGPPPVRSRDLRDLRGERSSEGR